MGIRTTSLKRFTSQVPKRLKSEAVAKIIGELERTCTIVDERVALKPESNTEDASCPIVLSLPEGVILVNSPHSKIVDYDSGVWHKPSAEALRQLSLLAHFSIRLSLKRFNRKYSCRLSTGNEAYKLLIELEGSLKGTTPEARIKALGNFSDFLNLPVKFHDSLQPPTGQHGTTISFHPGSETSSPNLSCSLSFELFASLLDRLLSETKSKLESWNASNEFSADFAKVIAAVNQLELPSGKLKLIYDWRLRSHRDFAVMTEMAARNEYGVASQSLVEFEFSEGKRAQLDITTKRNADFQLWFSFDAKEDLLTFTELTGVKLKAGW